MSAEGLLVGGLLRAIQDATDKRFDAQACMDLAKASAHARDALRRISISRLEGAEPPDPPPFISPHLTAAERVFVDGVSAGLVRKGVRLVNVQCAYGELFLTGLQPDGTLRVSRLRLIDAHWASQDGIVQSRSDIVRKLSRMRRAPLTPAIPPGEHLGNAKPDALPEDADCRDGRGGRPRPKHRTTTNPRRL